MHLGVMGCSHERDRLYCPVELSGGCKVLLAMDAQRDKICAASFAIVPRSDVRGRAGGNHHAVSPWRHTAAALCMDVFLGGAWRGCDLNIKVEFVRNVVVASTCCPCTLCFLLCVLASGTLSMQAESVLRFRQRRPSLHSFFCRRLIVDAEAS